MKKISFENKTQRLFGWVGLCFFIVLMSCGTEDVGQKAECVSNAECVAPKTCNVIQGLCEYVRTEPGRPTHPGELPDGDSDVGTTPSDSGDTGETTDSSTDNGDADVDSGSNTQVDVGQDTQEPELTMCEAISQSCDLSRPVQGDFVCVEGGGLGSICLQRCEQADHPSTCDPGFYCREYEVNGTSVLGCAAGGCVSNRDCDHIGPLGGNCIDQGNGYLECVEGGTILEGQACQGGEADRCMEGTRCRVTNSSTNAGVCARLCNPWSPIHTCPGIGFCEPFNSTQGSCSDHVERAGYYYLPYATCRNVGTMCDDASRCLAFTGGTNYCVPYCRAGRNDCSDVRQPGGFFGGGYATTCDLTVFTNNNQVGYCL